MIEIHLLEQLDAFARYGTLSAASEELHISQPALTRSMKKIEEELGVTLFERHKNRLFLNGTGKLAAELASQVLKENESFVKRIQAYDRSLRTISLGCCAPVPTYEFTPRLQQLYPEMTIQTEMRNSDEELLEGLQKDTYQLIVTHHNPEEDDLYLVECGHETLSIAVPPAHPLAMYDEISFADLEDVPILQLIRVGFWFDVVQKKIPNPHILLQDNEKTFYEIREMSALPTFHSDYFGSIDADSGTNRKIIPISDPEASTNYYLVCKRSDRRQYRLLFDNLPDWNQ